MTRAQSSALEPAETASTSVAPTKLADERAYDTAKRVLDVAVSAAALAAMSPLWLLIALLIKLTSPGPVLYAGQAVGKGGRVFTYYKFRSMRVDADDSHHRRFLAQYVQGDKPYTVVADPRTGEKRPVYKVVHDGRVTGLGRILRRFSLDEVPQFVNVLRGDMSVVGPRPPILYEYQLYDDWARQRLAVLPGITGLAQVRARGTASFTEMVELDLEYIRRRSLGLDMRIMAQTAWVMLAGRGYTG